MQDESEAPKKDILKKNNMQSKKMQEEERKGGVYGEATMNMFSPINDAGKPLGQ